MAELLRLAAFALILTDALSLLAIALRKWRRRRQNAEAKVYPDLGPPVPVEPWRPARMDRVGR